MLTGIPGGGGEEHHKEVSSKQIQKNKMGYSKALQGAYDRPLFPGPNPVIRPSNEMNNEGIWWLLP